VPACVCAVSACLPACSRDDTTAARQPAVVIAEVGHSPGQLVWPRCLDLDSSGNLWVIDKAARVQRLAPTGRPTALFHTPAWDDGKPCGVTIAPTNPAWASDAEAIYIADTHYFRVLVYAIPPEGFGVKLDDDENLRPPLLAQFGSYGTGPGQFIYTTDVAVLADDSGRAKTLYVGEYGGNDRISIYDAASLTFIRSIGTFSTDVTDARTLELSRPQSLAVDKARNRLVVADTCHHRIGVLTLEGDITRWIGGPGSSPDELAYPHGLALLPDGSALVSEVGNHRVKRIDLDTGKTLDIIGTQGRDPGQLISPWGIAARNDRGKLTAWILDSGNNRLQSFELGRVLAHGGAR
jgi:hypothetical protein